ncbi:MAG: glycerol kinase [Polyangiaceae bacterium UTPRO1]|jgi:glycerol kinase|nr:glycerol kinase GlpK [Myxococcales bacterium]OQY69286.1 MAG: glycerol kinase [Polyangiaceae bacterium UTPRO1]
MATKPTHVMAIDQGTTGSTVLVFDRRGRIAGRAYAELRQHYPQPGWVEHDAEEIWRVTLAVARQALRKAKVKAGALAAIGITNQRETAVVWDRRTGQPIHRAIVWQDRRTADVCAALKDAGAEAGIRAKTGLVLDPYFSATKIAWILDHVRGARGRAAAGDLVFGTIDSWLVWKLTAGKVHATDPTNASRTLLYDIHARRWDPELLRTFDVPAVMAPEVRPSSGVFGATEPHLLGAAVPIAGIAGDQQAALFGQGCLAPGMVKNTYGTGCFVLMQTGSEAVASARGLVTTIACGAGGAPTYALEGSVFIAGALVQWLRDGLKILKTAAESEALARQAASDLGVYVVPAFVGLGAPYWDPEARGAILGLTRGVGREHLVRAALESLAYQTRDVVETMAADAAKPITALRVDGGAAANDFLMQFQADVLGTTVDRPKVVETTAAGAAFLAGLGTGFWTQAELERVRAVDRVFKPKMKPEAREAAYAGWKDAVARVRSLPRP